MKGLFVVFHGFSAHSGISKKIFAQCDALRRNGADIVVTCTGSITAVVQVGDVHSALTGRSNPAPLMICDLGLPRDVDPAAGRLPGVHIVDIEGLRGD